MTWEQQQMMKWVILFHDVEKEPQPGKRDHVHGFRSAAGVAKALPDIGFPITTGYKTVFDEWNLFTLSASTTMGNPAVEVQDNQKLPEILNGIERMFGHNTPAALIIKTILFHLSIDMIEWPPPNPLTQEEVLRYFDGELLPLLKVMNLADGEGWALFDPVTRERQRLDTLQAFDRLERLLQRQGTKAGGLPYNPGMDHKEIVKAGYNKIADRYLAERRRNTENVRLLEELIVRLPEEAKVLDAGCGAGIPISLRLSEKFEVTGVDFSEAQIELARKNVPNARFLCEDMTRLDFPENVFDGITSYYAIIHIPREEHQSLLENFHRMLKPGGLALLCLGAEHLIDDIDDDFLGTRMYWSHFDSDTYIQMLKDCGFVIHWSKLVADETCEGANHLFILAQKG